jgi:Inner membrane protein YgaP-like, transmembrane domain
MITNVGVLDAALRLAVAAALLALSYGHFGLPAHSAAAWPAWIAGVIVGFTGVLRSCPLYAFLGTDSCAAYLRAGTGDRPQGR